MERIVRFLSVAILASVGALVLFGPLLLAPPPLGPTVIDNHELPSALVYGGRATLASCVGVALFSAILGIGLGIVNASEAGEARLAGFTDVTTSLPTLVTVALVAGAAGQSAFWGFVVCLGTLRALGIAQALASTLVRLTPGVALASRGPGLWALLRQELLPQAIVPLLTSAALSLPTVVGLEAALAFLELPSASVWSWGRLLVNPAPQARWLGALLLILTTGAIFVLFGSISRGTRRRAGALSQRLGLAAEADRSKSES